LPQAIETLRQGVAAVPGDVKMPLALADMLGASGKYEEAIAIYDSLLIRNPDLDVAANNMAEMIADYESGDRDALDKARRVADRFQGSSNPLLLDTLGWVYFRQGNVQQALVLFERAVASTADVPAQVHYHYGLALLKTNQKELARAQLQQATRGNRVFPGVDDAKKLLQTL
jgi:tetratricopeptide (TPR) repeat protein